MARVRIIYPEFKVKLIKQIGRRNQPIPKEYGALRARQS